MRSNRKVVFLVLAAAFLVGSAAFVTAQSIPIASWTPPATWSPSSGGKGMHTAGDIGGPLSLVPITPCRQFDSRVPVAPLIQNTNRTVTLSGAPCGIPAYSTAVAINITVFNITGAAGNGVFQIGTATNPTQAWINYPPTEAQRANAGVVPTAGGQIFVRVQQGAGQVDFTVDIFGYYPTLNSGQLLNPGEYFEVAVSIPPLFASINGRNNNTTDGSMGILGIAGGATGATIAVMGRNDGTGANTGVLGQTASTAVDSAGVRGISGSGLPAGAASCCGDVAVLGDSKNGVAVAGVSEVLAGFFDLKNSGGTFIAGASLGVAGTPTGVSYFNGLAGSGPKSFLEVHPTDPSKMIRYISLEGPEAGTYFRGTARVVHGQATIMVPEDFRIVTDDNGLTVQLTPVGASANMFIASEDLNQIVVRASRDVTFHYLVQGVRRAYPNMEPIVENSHFVPRNENSSFLEAVSALERQRLIDNGTFHADGTVNMVTAERVGWAKAWRDAAERSAKLAAERAQATKTEAP